MTPWPEGGVTLAQLRRAGARALLGPTFLAARAIGDAMERSPEEAVRRYQWDLVQEILHQAYDASPWYRRRLEAAGWPVETWDRFRAVPPLTRRDLELHAAEIARTAGGLSRTSGGSSGTPVTIPLDRDAYAWYFAGTWRGFHWWGVEPADPAVLLLGHTAGPRLRALLARSKDWVLGWRRVPIDGGFDAEVPRILARIEAFKPVLLYGYPSALHRLAGAIRARGRSLRARLRVIVLTGEPLYVFQRRTIMETFECPVAEEYGAGELGCLAFECPHGSLHVAAENALLEIVSGEAPDAGNAGRVLATHLHNRRFPLIRYDTGDLAAWHRGPCPCGRTLPLVRVLGRAQDRLIGPSGPMLARRTLEQLISLVPRRLEGRVRVWETAPGTVTIQVERDGTGSSLDLAEVARAGAHVFPRGWEVLVARVDRFARLPSGKLPLFLRKTA